jgi:hypothetical protein
VALVAYCSPALARARPPFATASPRLPGPSPEARRASLWSRQGHSSRPAQHQHVAHQQLLYASMPAAPRQHASSSTPACQQLLYASMPAALRQHASSCSTPACQQLYASMPAAALRQHASSSTPACQHASSCSTSSASALLPLLQLSRSGGSLLIASTSSAPAQPVY